MMHHIDKTSRKVTNMKRVFKEIELTDVNNDMCDKMVKSVICRVEKFEVSRSHKRVIEYSVAATMAFFGLIPIVFYIVQSSSQSGFGGYLSLLGSDSSYVFGHLNELVLPVASSLPLTGVMVVLLALLILTISLRLTVKNSEYSTTMKQRLNPIPPSL